MSFLKTLASAFGSRSELEKETGYKKVKEFGKFKLCKGYIVENNGCQFEAFLYDRSLLQESENKILDREIKIMTERLKGVTHIVQLIEHFNLQKHRVLIYTDKSDCQTLYKRFREEFNFRLNETCTALVITQVLNILKVCHDQDIVHRDLVRGILFQSSDMSHPKGDHLQLELSDFSDAVILSQEFFLKGNPTTEPFSPPEMYLEDDEDEEARVISKAVDMFAIGVITYTLLVGQLPFDAASNGISEKKIQFKSNPFDIDEEEKVPLSKGAKRFVIKLLNRKPSERMDVDQALDDPWLGNKVNSKHYENVSRFMEAENVETV